uniref:Tail completion or Neck1 protein n=1 Tax=Decurrovirus sp. TaxID=2832697 RepID=A0AAU8HXI9_9CAUD
MTGIFDGRVHLDGGSVEVQGIKRLMRDAERVGVAVDDLKELTYRLATPIAALARTLAPHRTGRLASSIKPSRSKRKVMVRVGSKSRMPYAAVHHWGRDGSSGPRWLSQAEETLRPRTFAGFGEGIKELLDKHDW